MRTRWALRLALLLAAAVPSVDAATAESQKNGFDLERSTIPPSEILQGGPPRDGIPAIDTPQFDTVREADQWLRVDDLVLSLVHENTARAYPTAILDFHEVVNDQVAGEPFAVTYCPLCGTGMVFKRFVGGETLVFGVSGLLYQSDVLLYDRQTESLWSQIGQRAVSGKYVGQPLELVPSQVMRWRAWKQRHPEGRVLSRRTGHPRPYGRSPYSSYMESPGTMFPVPQHRDELPPKEWVFGVVANGTAKAYRASALPDGSPLSDVVGGNAIQLHYDRDTLALRVLREGSGEELPHTRVFWFAWQAFHPDTELYLGGPAAP